ncbi:MAG: M48 family metallopeptidase [Nitrospiraceae bacterium]|nr:M48 family metallopeptidase [Nitrospiraceae bacterium]
MDTMQKYRFSLLAAYLLIQGFTFWLEWLNLRHMKGHGKEIPEGFGEYIDHASLDKASAYTIDRTRLGLLESVFGSVALLVFLFGGLLHRYDAWIRSLHLSFIPSGILFFLLLQYLSTVLSLPFSLYGTFMIERRYGFNTMTRGLWLSDFVKSTALSTLLLIALSAAGLWIVQASPEHWWLFAWIFFLAFSLFLMYISPYVIEPLFNKFTPLEGEGLTRKIQSVMEKAGIRVGSVMKVDASKRSHHTNAYFTGIGRVKRIVLYDTLIKKMAENEIVAVLAHEVGHWKRHHVLKSILALEVFALAGMYISFRALQAGLPAAFFSLDQGTFYAQIVILSFIAGIVTFPFTALSNYISRRHEREADRFAVELTSDPEGLATSLIKLSKDNLSNLHPHRLYAAFNYSHPPVKERIREIRSIQPGEPRDNGTGATA